MEKKTTGMFQQWDLPNKCRSFIVLKSVYQRVSCCPKHCAMFCIHACGLDDYVLFWNAYKYIYINNEPSHRWVNLSVVEQFGSELYLGQSCRVWEREIPSRQLVFFCRVTSNDNDSMCHGNVWNACESTISKRSGKVTNPRKKIYVRINCSAANYDKFWIYEPSSIL